MSKPRARWARIGVAVLTASLALTASPDSASSWSPLPVADPTGVDFDAACVVADPTETSIPNANNVPSPGLPSDGCSGFTTYDGSTEFTDLRSVGLRSTFVAHGPSNVQLTATWTVDGKIPPAGSTCRPFFDVAGCPDLSDGLAGGGGFKVMFQNPQRQTDTPYVAGVLVGANTPVYGLNEHWKDGFHFFVGFDVVWDGAEWIHSAQIGTYDPGPDGGFFFDELGANSGAGWFDDDPCAVNGTNWGVDVAGSTASVWVDGVVRFSDARAVGLCLNAEYARAGDSVINVKGLSTVNGTVVLPVAVPLSLIPGFSNLTAVGGIPHYSDITAGNSRNMGFFGFQLAAGDNPGTPCVNEGEGGNRLCVSYSEGRLGTFDTIGDGFRCWTSTFDGLLPANPFWVPDQPCYIDDDNIPGPTGNNDPGERGTFLLEWWDTNFSFTA